MVYIAGQVLGACLGYAALRLLFGEYGNLKDNGQSFCGTLPNVGDSGSFFIEFVITSILIMVCCGVWDPRNSLNTGELSSYQKRDFSYPTNFSIRSDSVSIRFGFVVTCLSIVAVKYYPYQHVFELNNELFLRAHIAELQWILLDLSLPHCTTGIGTAIGFTGLLHFPHLWWLPLHLEHFSSKRHQLFRKQRRSSRTMFKSDWIFYR